MYEEKKAWARARSNFSSIIIFLTQPEDRREARRKRRWMRSTLAHTKHNTQIPK
jgi:hypothetical protein